MFELRSRSVALGVTTGVAVLALPVVAWGQVPVVDQVVGGVNNAAQQVVQAAPAPPAPLPAAPVAPAPKPAAPAPAPAPSVAAPAPQSPSASAPAAAPARAATVSNSSAGSRSSARSGHATRASAASGKSSRGRHSHKRARAADTADPIPANAAGSPTDTDIADDAASVPPDASPAKLPFTGLQLAMLAMAGLAALASGSVLRRRTIR